jgi:hypothetical protein
VRLNLVLIASIQSEDTVLTLFDYLPSQNAWRERPGHAEVGQWKIDPHLPAKLR